MYDEQELKCTEQYLEKSLENNKYASEYIRELFLKEKNLENIFKFYGSKDIHIA
jgi:hypothetical protein